MNKAIAACLGVIIGVSPCSFADTNETNAKARAIAQNYIILDAHIDLPFRLTQKWQDVTKATPDGDFDYPRAIQGGLNAPFMAIYTPATLDGKPQAFTHANKMIDSVLAIASTAPKKFAVATSAQSVLDHFQQGLISLPMGMENGSPIAGDMKNLQHFYDRGVRYITLTHSQSNHISDSSYDLRRKWQGLSPFGKELLVAMNNMGMMIDISHVSEQAFYQVMALSRAPVIASHTSLRQFTPGFERNMDDKMLKALAKNGGVIQINFGSSFVSQLANTWYDLMAVKRNTFDKQYGRGSPQSKSFERRYRRKSPYPYATLETVLDHIDHAVKLVGINHVGIGSDFDGVGDSLPEGLKDVSAYPNLIAGLLNRGYTEQEIEKILSGNFLRVWREVENIAEQNNTKHE